MTEFRRLAAAVWLLIAPAPPAEADQRGRENERVCVPSADGRSWECGTRANPPPERGLSSLPREERRAAAPPPFLAAPGPMAAPLAPPVASPPQRAARDAFPPAPPREDAPRAAEVGSLAESEPAAVEPLAPPAGPSPPGLAPLPRPEPVSAPPPMLAAPRPPLAPYAPAAPPVATPLPAASVAVTPAAAEPVAAEPVAAEPVAAEPVAAEPVAAEPVAAEPVAAEPVAAEPVAADSSTAPPVVAATTSAPAPSMPPPAPIRARTDGIMVFGDRDAFLALPPQRATLQLARATRLGELYSTWQQLVADSGGALARGTAYVVTLDAGGSPQALLLWSDFADAAAARAAWDALPGFPAGKPAAYARRIAPLQDEIRRARSNP